MSGATHVPHLQNRGSPQTLLHIEIVVKEVRCAEVLIYRKDIEYLVRTETLGIGLEVTGTGGRARENRRSSGLSGLPVIVIPAKTVDGVGANRIVLQTIRGADGRTEIQEWIHIDLVEENPDSTAHHEAGGGLVCEAESRCEVFVIGRKDRIDTLSLYQKPTALHKNSEIIGAIAVQGAEVLITQPQVYIELRSNLPGIGREEIVPVHQHLAFRVTYCYRGRADIARQK